MSKKVKSKTSLTNSLVNEVSKKANATDKAQEIIAKKAAAAAKPIKGVLARVVTDTIKGIKVKMYKAFTLARGKGINGLYDQIEALGMTSSDGIHGGLSLAAMSLAGYVTLSKTMRLARSKTAGNGALLALLTGGAIAPNRKSGYHRTRAYFNANGQLTADGVIWASNRFTDTKDNDGRPVYPTTRTIVLAIREAMKGKTGSKVKIASRLDKERKITLDISSEVSTSV